MAAILPPAGTLNGAQKFWHGHIAYFFAPKERTALATMSDSTQVDAGADKQYRRDSVGFKVLAQRKQLCVRATGSITSYDSRAGVTAKIEKEVTLVRGQAGSALA